MNVFNDCLQRMKQRCVIQDPEYWDVQLIEGETPIAPECDYETLTLTTKEGFLITIKQMVRGFGPIFFNGYVSIPSGLHHLRTWIHDNPSYDDMNYNLDIGVEFTDFNIRKLEYGWDHAHGWDADLGKPLASQNNKRVSGPVQVLEEARGVVRAIMSKEMSDKRQEIELIREELMMKACHPKRIAVWTAAGFDPFE